MAQSHIPELIFNTQFLRLRALKEKRQKVLKKISNLDPTQYYKGNLILAVNHPSPASLDSKELEQTTRGIYFIKRVFPTHLRLTDIFSGAQRTLPKKFCYKVKLDDLALMRTTLKNHQLKKLNDNLAKNNRFLPPNLEKSWRHIMTSRLNEVDKTDTSDIRQTEDEDNFAHIPSDLIDGPDDPTTKLNGPEDPTTKSDGPENPATKLDGPSTQPEGPAPYHSDHNSARPCPQVTVQKQPSIKFKAAEQKVDSGTSGQHDNEQKLNRHSYHPAQPPTPPATTNHPPLAKVTRSGATYLAGSTEPPRHIRTQPLDKCTHRQLSAKKVTFSDQVETNSGGNISFSPLTDCKQITNYFYFVLTAIDMDFSTKELFYTPIHSQPCSERIQCDTDDNLE